MTDQAPDYFKLLECLSGRLPAFRLALLELANADLERVELAAGEVLLRKGEKAHALYVVVAGMLRATTVQDDGRELVLSKFGPGEMAGESNGYGGSGHVRRTQLVRVSCCESANARHRKLDVFH